MKPQFPKFLYPIQKCDGYGEFPTIITFPPGNNKFTYMLSVLTGILSPVKKVWVHVTKVKMRQSYWHGWLLTFITDKCFRKSVLGLQKDILFGCYTCGTFRD